LTPFLVLGLVSNIELSIFISEKYPFILAGLLQ